MVTSGLEPAVSEGTGNTPRELMSLEHRLGRVLRCGGEEGGPVAPGRVSFRERTRSFGGGGWAGVGGSTRHGPGAGSWCWGVFKRVGSP